jgi:hypothetical protein
MERAVVRALSLGRTGEEYEQSFRSATLAYIRPGDCVRDVGANVVLYSGLFAAAVRPSGKVISFEPSRMRALLEVRLSGVPARGPRDLTASRRSFLFGLQYSDGRKAVGRPGDGRLEHDSEPAGPVQYAYAERRRNALLSPPGGGRGRCRAPGRWSSSALDTAESRVGIDAQLILSAVQRSILLWPETKTDREAASIWRTPHGPALTFTARRGSWPSVH